jgi:hypothetical protein
MSLLFNGANKNLALGMGIAPQGGQAGSGVITLHGGDGHVLLNLGASSAGGAIAVNNAGGANVANLGVSGTGGALDILGNSSELEAQLAAHAQAGYLAIASGGSAKVEAGATSGGIGVVRAFGPGGFNAIEGRSNN